MALSTVLTRGVKRDILYLKSCCETFQTSRLPSNLGHITRKCRPNTPYLCTHSSVRFSSRDSGHSSTWAFRSYASFRNYLSSLKWVPIPLGVGFAYLCYQQFGHIKERERRKIQGIKNPEELLASEFQINLYRKIPLRFTSRLWGQVNNVEVPNWLRTPIYQLYVWLFNCNVSEAAIEDLQYYKNLQEFFRRQLKPSVRPVDQEHGVVSPADGKVLHFGKVVQSHVEQVKGVTYSLKVFLGPNTWNDNNNNADIEVSDADYQNSINVQPGNSLYHCIVYLAPGDYHRFHSPVDWTISYRRHFPGELFSVSPGIARWIKGLFNYNERVVLYGQWKHGFFSMAAVGATNVGSIKIYCDKDLSTNMVGKFDKDSFHDKDLTCKHREEGIPMKKGENLGEFNLGSTIVLIFEAPKDFDFTVESGQKIRFGEKMGNQ